MYSDYCLNKNRFPLFVMWSFGIWASHWKQEMVKRFIISFLPLFCTHFLISPRKTLTSLLLIRHGVFWFSSDIMLQCIGGFFASLLRCCDLDLYKQSRGLDDPELLARETVCMSIILSFLCGFVYRWTHPIYTVTSTWLPPLLFVNSLYWTH